MCVRLGKLHDVHRVSTRRLRGRSSGGSVEVERVACCVMYTYCMYTYIGKGTVRTACIVSSVRGFFSKASSKVFSGKNKMRR
jgi:hypothetical protein